VSAKELEGEMEAALQMAQQKIQKLSKKSTATTEKYNELTDTYNSLTEELIRVTNELEQARKNQGSNTRLSEQNALYITQIEEMTTRITTMTTTTEKYKLQIETHIQERISMQSEIETLHSQRKEQEKQNAKKIAALEAEVEKVRVDAGNAKEMQNMSKTIEEQNAEIHELKAKLASAAISVKSTFITNNTTNNTVINNSFFETIVNSTNETNVFITNVIKSGNVDKIREALINQVGVVKFQSGF
jgi:chromosome segregation ATPase